MADASARGCPVSYLVAWEQGREEAGNPPSIEITPAAAA
jgi:hypothetical protein